MNIITNQISFVKGYLTALPFFSQRQEPVEKDGREQADAEAYAVKVQAEAEAEANKLVAASLTTALIQYHQAQNWNGQLPSVVTGDTALPILDLGNVTAD